MDFSDVIVHIFKDDVRPFYALERLWGDAPRLDVRLDPEGALPPVLPKPAKRPRARSEGGRRRTNKG
jgi:hypothetical protein